MMKQLYKIIPILLFIPLWSACSDGNENSETDQDILLEGIQVQLADRSMYTNTDTRATISGYVVNTDADPTSNNASDEARLTGQNSWNLDVKIYDKTATTLYGPANGTWSFGTTSWVPTPNPLYLPSYFKPKVETTLYYGSSEQPVSTQQGTSDALLQQDILVQRSDPYFVTPAHIMSLELIHKHAMLDFVLTNVNYSDIKSLTVVAGSDTYNPYKVVGTTVEYLLILPEGVSNPQVKIETNGGARYTKTLNIASTVRNNCYCITFTGVELILSSVTVVDWTFGTALGGQYTTPASYPTFRGIPNSTVILVYDNGLEQSITFNERGEATEKPLGRTIVKVGDRDISANPIILNEMYVDLLGYMS